MTRLDDESLCPNRVLSIRKNQDAERALIKNNAESARKLDLRMLDQQNEA